VVRENEKIAPNRGVRKKGTKGGGGGVKPGKLPSPNLGGHLGIWDNVTQGNKWGGGVHQKGGGELGGPRSGGQRKWWGDQKTSAKGVFFPQTTRGGGRKGPKGGPTLGGNKRGRGGGKFKKKGGKNNPRETRAHKGKNHQRQKMLFKLLGRSGQKKKGKGGGKQHLWTTGGGGGGHFGAPGKIWGKMWD